MRNQNSVAWYKENKTIYTSHRVIIQEFFNKWCLERDMTISASNFILWAEQFGIINQQKAFEYAEKMRNESSLPK